MYKLILQDYRSHWRSGLKKMLNTSFSYIWFAVMSTLYAPNEPAFCGLLIPFLLTYFLSRMYGGYQNKTLFLCPFDKNTRQEYAVKSIRLRIIIPTVLFFIINLTLLAFERISVITFLLELFIFSCMVIYLNMYCQPIITGSAKKEIIYPVLGNYEALNGCSHVCSYINICFISSLSEMQKMPNVWVLVFFGFFAILQFTLCANMVKKFYKQIIRETEFYN